MELIIRLFWTNYNFIMTNHYLSLINENSYSYTSNLINGPLHIFDSGNCIVLALTVSKTIAGGARCERP